MWTPFRNFSSRKFGELLPNVNSKEQWSILVLCEVSFNNALFIHYGSPVWLNMFTSVSVWKQRNVTINKMLQWDFFSSLGIICRSLLYTLVCFFPHLNNQSYLRWFCFCWQANNGNQRESQGWQKTCRPQRGGKEHGTLSEHWAIPPRTEIINKNKNKELKWYGLASFSIC